MSIQARKNKECVNLLLNELCYILYIWYTVNRLFSPPGPNLFQAHLRGGVGGGGGGANSDGGLI